MRYTVSVAADDGTVIYSTDVDLDEPALEIPTQPPLNLPETGAMMVAVGRAAVLQAGIQVSDGTD